MGKAALVPHIRASYVRMTRGKEETKFIEQRIIRGLADGKIFKITSS